MAKVFIEETTLTAIGDAIREKTGGTDLITPGNMPNEIKGIVSGGGSDDCNGLHIPEEALTITGNCEYRFATNSWNWFINQVGDKITTKDITRCNNMFYYSYDLKSIPFSINLKAGYENDFSYMFQDCRNLVEIPMIYGAKPKVMTYSFSSMKKIKSFPENFAEDWDWSYIDNMTSSYDGNMSYMFSYCPNLRTIPQVLLSHGNPVASNSYATTYGRFFQCYSLEKIENVFIPYNAVYSSNAFYGCVDRCCRLKKFSLMTQGDGTPYAVNWKNQTIDLTTAGFSPNANHMTIFTDFTIDTKIDSEEKWRGYINGSYPDGWADDVAYSTFGATAVKELIATLPTTSGTGCVVKLKQGASSAIPGEEMTSLTEEDIAVAAAKGWTVTLV